ncbi:MAG: 7,8-didemethyl-8-hydroxy-5-deazariboflavin synthase subunit CofG [SAR202 cluster bacterium Casp-Chloro-G3]|nr:7,8-didemethyl-8-hydroxy-5-deazariboflavin synthase CofG [Chloroflexota bacterium]PKB56814.1 MAG: 7,8-didemethyl-8-hydroxy-5-deazariboflavin synthase subunit CofG [SAR202 cluster bacterium Casp-Chloro-G3]
MSISASKIESPIGDRPVSDMLEQVRFGQSLTDAEALTLLTVEEESMADLCQVAAGLRDQGKGRVVTFSPKVFIPLTRLCRDYCGYCTFRQEPASAETLYLSPEEVLAVASAGQQLGCTEALFTLGERPEQKYSEAKDWLERRGYATTLEYLADMCKLVLNETLLLPHANPGTMSRREMAALQPYNPSMGLMLESTSEKLYATGGPHEFAPSKRPRVRLRTTEIAGELGIPFTSGILIGIGDSRRDRVESLLAIRRLHQTYGHIQEMIIQNFRAKPDTPMSNSADATSAEMLWTVAVARILLGPNINIQVPPNLSAQDYQIYLDAGINDWGGVSPLTIDYVNPEAPWPGLSDLRDRTLAMGFELRPRLPVYPEYFVNTDQYLPTALRAKAIALADGDGYVKGGMQRYVSSN